MGLAHCNRLTMIRVGYSNHTFALKLSPRNTYAYFSCGLTCYSLGDRQGAIEDYSTAIRLNSTLANTFIQT
jgi:tetratricopeptide (TPR) repeat protein